MSDVIRLHDLQKRFGSTVALDGVSMECGGGVTGLLGPNGAGKSTLIKILMGLIKASGGSGTVLGLEIGRDGRQIRSRVGYMPEDDCYIAGLTGIEMLRFSANLAGLPYVEGLRRSHEILDFCGVGQERYRIVDTYSTGMRQKVKFAAAIVHDPDLLILDEPTSGLDPEERMALLSRLRVLADEHHKAVLLSTHILPDVQLVCDHVIIVAQGRIQVSDRLANLNRSASPAMQLRLLGDVEAAEQELSRGGFEVLQRAGNQLTIGGNSSDLARSLWSFCSQHDIRLQAMTAGKTSLEKVFMDSVRETDHADS